MRVDNRMRSARQRVVGRMKIGMTLSKISMIAGGLGGVISERESGYHKDK